MIGRICMYGECNVCMTDMSELEFGSVLETEIRL